MVAFACFFFYFGAVGCGHTGDGQLCLKAMFRIFHHVSKVRFVGMPPLLAQIGYAFEGVVVSSGDVVHVVALDGSLSYVGSVELVVDGELHSVAVVREGVAKHARLRLDGLHEGPSVGQDGRDAEVRGAR